MKEKALKFSAQKQTQNMLCRSKNYIVLHCFCIVLMLIFHPNLGPDFNIYYWIYRNCGICCFACWKLLDFVMFCFFERFFNETFEFWAMELRWLTSPSSFLFSCVDGWCDLEDVKRIEVILAWNFGRTCKDV
ncbi:hypothetical protein RYX36_035863 [Vicia faba]